MIDALKAIKKPLAEPCSQDDISQLETKRTTAKAAALDAIKKQDEIQDAAFKKLKAANEKLDSLNEQLKGRHCFNINENLYGTQNYDLLFVKSNELVGIWKFVFDQNIAITMELPGILFSCTSSSSSSRQNDQSSTTVCTSLTEVPLGQHNIEVSSGDSSASGYTPWVKAPMPITFTVGDEDKCKQGITCFPEGDVFYCTDDVEENDSTGASGADSGATQASENSNNINVVSLTEAADPGLNAAYEAHDELTKLNLNDFLASGRSKR